MYTQKSTFLLFAYECHTGEPQKTYLWIMVIPTFTFLCLMFSLVGYGFFVGINEQGQVKNSLIQFCLVAYDVLTALLNLVFIVVTFRTRKSVRTNIYVRGELIFQTALLLLSYIILLVIFLLDALLDDGKEQYDEIFNLGYFINSTICCLCSIIIGTQYLPFKEWRRQRVLARRNLPRIAGQIVAGGIRMNCKEIDFRAVIAMSDGLDAFMRYLAKQNEQNYLIVELFNLISLVVHFSHLYCSVACIISACNGIDAVYDTFVPPCRYRSISSGSD